MRKLSEKTLLEAIRLVGPTPGAYQEIARHLRDAGLPAEAEKYAAMSRGMPPQSAWEHYALGRSFLQSKLFAEAESELRLATSLAADHYWYQFYAGVVAYQLGNIPDAISAFGACIALEPQRAECYHYRGLAFSGNHQPERAKADFAQAQRLAEPSP